MHMRDRKRKGIKAGRSPGNKTPVLGMRQRDGRVHAEVIPNVKRDTIQPRVRQSVERGSAVYTDAYHVYTGLDGDFAHRVIDHAEKYVEGRVHTNGIENFWSLVKRGLHGTYVSVEPFHLFRYLDEQAFRFNERDGQDADRFKKALKSVTGRRLTYSELTGKHSTL